MISSNDLARRFKIKTKRIWILELRKKKFFIGHPNEYQELIAEKEVREIINKLKIDFVK